MMGSMHEKMDRSVSTPDSFSRMCLSISLHVKSEYSNYLGVRKFITVSTVLALTWEVLKYKGCFSIVRSFFSIVKETTHTNRERISRKYASFKQNRVLDLKILIFVCLAS